MRMLVALLMGALTAASSPEGEHGPIWSGMPPERMRGDSAAVVAYVANPDAVCGSGANSTTLACVRRVNGVKVAILPNPCLLGDVELFARLACHEAAHYAHDWGRNHEE